MAGKFELRKFSEINLDDSFFDELKRDYPGTASSTGFVKWFDKKSQEGKTALVFSDEAGLGAFICIKPEEEILKLQEKELPAIPRIKINTSYCRKISWTAFRRRCTRFDFMEMATVYVR